MRSYLPTVVAALAAFSLTGCKTCDLVEAELRYQTRRVRQLERCLCEKQAEIETLQAIVEKRSAKPSSPATETADEIYRRTAMSKVTLGPGTGGRDLDRDGLNEAVQFTIVCLDYDGDSFKCPGEAELDLFAYTDTGEQELVGHWTFGAEELRQLWKSSVIGSGYQVIVPVVLSSTASKWRFHVQFTTLDGRRFEDSRDILMKIAPPPVETPPPPSAPEDASDEAAKDSTATQLVPAGRWLPGNRVAGLDGLVSVSGTSDACPLQKAKLKKPIPLSP